MNFRSEEVPPPHHQDCKGNPKIFNLTGEISQGRQPPLALSAWPTNPGHPQSAPFSGPLPKAKENSINERQRYWQNLSSLVPRDATPLHRHIWDINCASRSPQCGAEGGGLNSTHLKQAHTMATQPCRKLTGRHQQKAGCQFLWYKLHRRSSTATQRPRQMPRSEKWRSPLRADPIVTVSPTPHPTPPHTHTCILFPSRKLFGKSKKIKLTSRKSSTEEMGTGESTTLACSK